MDQSQFEDKETSSYDESDHFVLPSKRTTRFIEFLDEHYRNQNSTLVHFLGISAITRSVTYLYNREKIDYEAINALVEEHEVALKKYQAMGGIMPSYVGLGLEEDACTEARATRLAKHLKTEKFSGPAEQLELDPVIGVGTQDFPSEVYETAEPMPEPVPVIGPTDVDDID